MVKDPKRYVFEDNKNGRAQPLLVEMSDQKLLKDSNGPDPKLVVTHNDPDSPGSSQQSSLGDGLNKTHAPRPSARSYMAVCILFIINLLNYMDRFTVAGVLTDVQKFYSITDADAGLLQTVFIVAYMLFAPICGYLGDRYNRRFIMGVGLLIWSGAVLLSTFVPAEKFWLFIICRGAVGIGEASYATVSPTLIADMFTKDIRSRMLMIFYFAIPIGSGLGFVVGANVAHLAGDFRWGIRVTPIFGIICLLLIILVLREPERGESEGTPVEPSSFRQDLLHLVKNRSYVWSTIGFTSVVFVAGSMTWWTPNAVIHSFSMNQGSPATEDQKAHINLIFGVITCIAGFVGVTVGAGWALVWRRTNPRADPLVCGIGALACVPFLYFALNTVHWNMVAGWIFIFFAITLLCLNWSVVVDMLLYIVIPGRRATASAFQILFSHLLGDAASPYIIGLVSDKLRGDRTDAAARFYSLQYALYIPNFVLVLGGFFFLGTSWYIQRDRTIAELAVKGADVPTVTVASGQPHDSTAQLLPPVQPTQNNVVGTENVTFQERF